MPKDFSGQDLRGKSFAGKNLTGANFRDADIRGVTFKGATLVNTDFRGAKIGQFDGYSYFRKELMPLVLSMLLFLLLSLSIYVIVDYFILENFTKIIIIVSFWEG